MAYVNEGAPKTEQKGKTSTYGNCVIKPRFKKKKKANIWKERIKPI